MGEADAPPEAPTTEGHWDERRLGTLGGALIAAANGAGIGLSVVLMDPPHPRAVYITDMGVQILGHPRAAILSQSALSFLSPEERDASAAKGLSGGAPRGNRSVETEIVTSDGRRVPLEVSIAELQIEGRPVVVTFFRDISDRRRSIEALRRSEESFRKLIELAPDAVWINDSRRLLFANPATVKTLGYETTEQVLALSPAEIIHPEDRKLMRERMEQMLQSGTPLPVRDYRVRRRDGSFVVTEVQSMPLEWEGVPAILGIARDVTARRQLEAQVVRNDRLAALGTLLAGIAHELNNPLAYVLLGIEQAFAGLDTLLVRPDGVERLREVLADVHQGFDRVAAVVRQLRVSSRPEVEERGLVDVRRVLQSALRVVQNEVRHRARVTVELTEVPALEGSAQRLEQVFLNLLVNALQALPEGRPNNEIRVVLRAGSGEQVVVEISDNGAGIPTDVVPRIFDPFFTTKPLGLGMGLGLSICHGIVSAHGGTITVDTEPGRGTTFCLTLPLRKSAGGRVGVAAERAPLERPPLPGRRRRVLIVDDEAPLGDAMQRMLAADFDVDVVTDARRALEMIAAATGGYDVVLCDLMMPEMTGMELYATVARGQSGLERKFVFMTGGAFTPGAAQFLEAAKNPCLEKPFDFAALRAALDRDA